MMNTPSALFHSGLNTEITSCSTVKSFPEGSVVLEEDHYIRSIPIVLKGTLRVVRADESGHEILLYFIHPGETCIMSFLGSMHHQTSKLRAIAEEDCEVMLIPAEKAAEWISRFPEWTEFIFKLYHKRFEELLSVVNAVAFQKLDERVAALLKQRSTASGSKEVRITHQQIADALGSTREVISRIVKDMENQGLIKLSRNKILLL